MATHKSAEKRARQAPKRSARNNQVRAKVHTAVRIVRSSLADPKKAAENLSQAFSSIQKAKGVLHRNAVRRKMARLAKAVARGAKAAS